MSLYAQLTLLAKSPDRAWEGVCHVRAHWTPNVRNARRFIQTLTGNHPCYASLQRARRWGHSSANYIEISDKQENVGSILINISAGTKETAETIIIAGAIPLIAEKLQKRVNWSGPQKTEVNFVWCLMNLATDGKNPREVLIADGLDKILVPTSCFLTNI